MTKKEKIIREITTALSYILVAALAAVITLALTTGTSGGFTIRDDSKLEQLMRRVKVKALYNIIPEKIEVDVTNLEIGKAIKVGELSQEGLEFTNSKDAVLCTVAATRSAAKKND